MSVSSSHNMWSYVAPYIIPPLAASGAIVPVYYGFVIKSSQQLGNPISKMKAIEIVKGGIKTSPTIGLIVGIQMISQNVMENQLRKISFIKDSISNFNKMLISSMIVGAVSAPALAVFNGQTMGRGALESLKLLSFKQGGAIVIRETSFLFSLRVSGPLSGQMKRYCGENKAVENGSAFVSGAIGSIIGHPFDTALTRWQKGMKIETIRQSMRGSPAKAIAVGGFSVLYKNGKEILESL